MVSKRNPGRGSKDNKKATPKNEKQKIPAVSKQKKGRKGKDICATDLRVDENWPPKPWIKIHRKGKTQCYRNPESKQEYYTEADLERHLVCWARRGAKKDEDLDIPNKKMDSDETSEMTISDEMENVQRRTKMESDETSETTISDEMENVQRTMKMESDETSETTISDGRENVQRTSEMESDDTSESTISDGRENVQRTLKMESDETSETTISDEREDVQRTSKMESDETSEMTISDEREDVQRTTKDEGVFEIHSDGKVDDLDYILREIESMETAKAIPSDEKAVVDDASSNTLPESWTWDTQFYMMDEATTSGEKAIPEEITNDNATPEQDSDEEFVRERKRKGKEVVKVCDKCNKEKCKCRPKDGVSRGGVIIRQT